MTESLFERVRLYRGVTAKWPIPHGAERDVSEVWVALCEVVEAASLVAEWRYYDPIGDFGRAKHEAEYDRLEAALRKFEIDVPADVDRRFA